MLVLFNKMLVLFNKMLVLFNKMLVFFDRSIRIPRAHARVHKVFYPCNRCHLATLLENQYVTCDNEVTRVTTNGVFAKMLHAGCEAPGFEGRRCRLQGSEVPPPWVEARGSKGRRYGLHAPWGLSLRPLGIVPIGTSDKLYLYQMEALTDPIMGFNRYEKRLQSVTIINIGVNTW